MPRIELPANFGADRRTSATATATTGDLFYDDSYMDWSVGVTYALGHFTFGLKYVDGSDLEACRRHAGRRLQQRRRGDLLGLDLVPLVEGVIARRA